MKLPRWTTYPALVVLSGAIWMGVPDVLEDPYAGAAIAAREAAPAPAPTAFPRLVILGIDGLDPDLLQESIDRFPERTKNFQALVAQGAGIQDLATSVPPQSPVAWSNFITGRNPGGHGIFDFIHRDAATYGVKSSISNDEAGTDIHLLGTNYKMPWGGSSEPNRTGQAFWSVLGEHDVPADVWRMPINYPVEPGKGLSFPGMMTPAVDSAYGESTLFTTDIAKKLEVEVAGGKAKQLNFRMGKAVTQIPGPMNSFKDEVVEVEVGGDNIGPNEGRVEKETEEHRVPALCEAGLTVYITDEAAALTIDGGDTLVLRPGEWSDFVPVNFSMVPMGMSDMGGIVRFYLRSVAPEVEIYMSPVNMDPMAPAAIISEPDTAAADLAGQIGLYYTQGMAEDVGALKRGLIDVPEFMQQSTLVYEERGRMLDVALDRYMTNDEGGLLFFYYSSVDLCAHMMWRHTDVDHPHHEPEVAAQDSEWWSEREGSTWKDTVMDLILRMDPVLGEIQERIGADTALVVMSDHGFAPYRRKFDLNSWLFDNGYLVLKEGRSKELPVGSEGFAEVHLSDAVDWSKTRAYGMGFNGLYLNLAEREAEGIVKPGAEADALVAELKQKLEALVDPKDGVSRPVYRCDLAKDVYVGERVAEAPDIQVGYNSNYGNSDEASVGRITNSWLSDNLGGTFNGSHLMSPDVVAGILLTNRELEAGAHGLVDITASILRFYGVDLLPGMIGKPAFK